MSSDNVQALTPGTRLGDYRLDAVIGHGGFGITYRAFDTQLAKFVAIKEYLPVEFAVRDDGKVVARGTRFAEDFAWGRERFLDEARALARFRHLHIVPVLRYFEANGTAYTVMEFEDGKSVGELLRQPAGRLSPNDVQRLADGLVGGLSAVHAQGFLHRDIKPSNIIIRRDGIPVLIDFGAARQAMGERTRTMTGVLTPQYAPIEQYALDGKQGPWSDIYSAAAVLHHAIAGLPPPDAAARVGTDPYRTLATTHADRFESAFLGAIDRALAFAPPDRPQTVEEWAALFGPSIARVADAPTQRLGGASGATPRLGGVSREVDPPALPPPARRSRNALWVVALLVVVVGAAAAWRFNPQLQAMIAGTPSAEQPVATSTPTPQPVSQPTPTLTPTPATPPAPAPDTAKQALIDQAGRAAVAARAVLERADEAARAARAMAGEARIVAARAARPDLQNAERLANDGVSYVGQTSDGNRQGLGVAELGSGERQAGDFQDGRLNGLGTVRFEDDTRYAGQWRDGQATGLGAREKPGVDRAEGNFVAGRLEGLGVRRTLVEPATVQSGEFRADLLEGPGVETVGDRRYEGGFRAGKRHGFGQVTSADGKAQSGRWEDGKPIETTP
ncbi:MAG: protein kinase [Rhodospirillales bacterium]|nr:protein kinase [Rhodospirillales bacterium]